MTIPRDKNTMFQEPVVFDRDCPAISATITLPIVTPSTKGRPFQVERVELMVDATYAADAANFYAFTLEHGAGPTAIATWSTQTSAQGAITAGVPVAMVLNATAANLVVPSLDVISLLATKAASAANITPRVVIHGKYI